MKMQTRWHLPFTSKLVVEISEAIQKETIKLDAWTPAEAFFKAINPNRRKHAVSIETVLFHLAADRRWKLEALIVNPSALGNRPETLLKLSTRRIKMKSFSLRVPCRLTAKSGRVFEFAQGSKFFALPERDLAALGICLSFGEVFALRQFDYFENSDPLKSGFKISSSLLDPA